MTSDALQLNTSDQILANEVGDILQNRNTNSHTRYELLAISDGAPLTIPIGNRYTRWN